MSLPANTIRPPLGGKTPGDHVEQCGLARPVRPQNADDLARLDFKVEPVDDDEPAEGARERSEFKHRFYLSRTPA